MKHGVSGVKKRNNENISSDQRSIKHQKRNMAKNNGALARKAPASYRSENEGVSGVTFTASILPAIVRYPPIPYACVLASCHGTTLKAFLLPACH